MSHPLDEKHRNELHASGISDAMIQAAQIHTVADGEIKRLLGWSLKDAQWGRGFAIPFPLAGSPEAVYCRVKLDNPRKLRGKEVKYESPKGSEPRAYFPPGTEAIVNDPAVPLWFTEGEKKTLAGRQHGLPTIGLVGVWGFARARQRNKKGLGTGPRRMLPELEQIAWRDRVVFIAFDSDAATNEQVRNAEKSLAGLLSGRGASVNIVRLPPDEGRKVGLDDFLMQHGDSGVEKLQTLVLSTEAADKRMANQSNSPMRLADDLLAEQFYRADERVLAYWRGELHIHCGTHYVPTSRDEFTKHVITWLDKRGHRAGSQLAREIVECLCARVLVPGEIEQPHWLGARNGPANQSDWIACKNGILSIPLALSNEALPLRPHSANWFSPFSLPYNYDSRTECPQWFSFLDEVLDGDEERVELLAQFFGLCLTSETRFQKILMLQGPRRSGKGTILRMLRRVVGETNCVDPRLSLLGEPFGLAGLLGKRVAICADAHLGHGDRAMGVLETIKNISGEDSIEVHRKYLPSVNVRLRIRFVLGVNDLPKFGDSAGAISSRLLVVPLRKSFEGREDYALEEKLAAETPAVLNWALWGLGRLRQVGRFIVPSVSAEITAAFKRLSSPLSAFLEDCCIIEPGRSIVRDELFRTWQSWCITNGHRSGTHEEFGVRLRTLIPDVNGGQRRINGDRHWIYVGVDLASSVRVSQASQANDRCDMYARD